VRERHGLSRKSSAAFQPDKLRPFAWLARAARSLRAPLSRALAVSGPLMSAAD